MSNGNSVSEAARVEVLKMAVELVERVVGNSDDVSRSHLRRLGLLKDDLPESLPLPVAIEATYKGLLAILEGSGEVESLHVRDH